MRTSVRVAGAIGAGALVVLTAVGCSSDSKSKESSTSAASSASSTSSSAAAQPADYTALLIKATDLVAPEVFSASAPIPNPNGNPGVAASFSNPDGTHVVGDTILILSDRDADRARAPIPSLLATASVHHHLVRLGQRTRCALIVDTNGDDKADKEIEVAGGWKETFHQVDGLGVAYDRRDGSVYYGRGTGNFTDPLLRDKDGNVVAELNVPNGASVEVTPTPAATPPQAPASATHDAEGTEPPGRGAEASTRALRARRRTLALRVLGSSWTNLT